MNYQSLEFLAFALIVLVLYFAVGVKRQKYVLLLANLYFFFSAGIENIPFILITLVASFLVGKRMGKVYEDADIRLKECTDAPSKKQVRADAKAGAKKYLIWGLLIVLGQLILFKSWGIAVGVLNKTRENPLSGFMPLGVSYYTFMAISYMLDIYWKKIKYEKNIVPYAVFLSYFPHIVQGPIDRYSSLGKTLNEGTKFDYKNFTFGAQLALWGLFKKMVIADRMSIIANEILPNFNMYSGAFLLLAAVASAFEMYCNFSGCVDMVRGFSQMLGIELLENFNNPFFTKTVAEFWRCWHMTLSGFFRDYVFMPISISPKLNKLTKTVKGKYGDRPAKVVNLLIPTAVVWMLTGLWHGTGLNYIMWGLYWCVLMCGSTALQPEFEKLNQLLHVKSDSFGWKLFQMVRTFFLFAIGRVITTSARPLDVLRIFKRIVLNFDFFSIFEFKTSITGLAAADMSLLLVALFVLWAVSMFHRNGSVREKIAGCNIVTRWILFYALFFAVVIFGMYGPGFEAANFVYGNF